MKKVCFVVSSPLTAKSFLKEPIYRLSNLCDVSLIVNLNGTDSGFLLKDFPVKQTIHFKIERKINIINDLICLFNLIKFFKKNKYDVIHSVSPKAGLISMLAGYLSNIPVRIHTFTGQVWSTKRGIFRFILKKIDSLISHCSTNLLTDSKSQLIFLKNQGFKKKINILGNGSICGVSLNRFNPSNIERENQRKKLKILKNETVFMFIGRINKDKGVIDLIEAFKKIDATEFPCSLFIIGNDENEIRFKYEFKNPNIHFFSYEENPENVLQACDVFCLPSYREGFGMSIIEASALEKPVICSDAYGLRDTIIDQETGLRHRVGDVGQLKQKIEYALLNPKKMKRMGKKGRIYVSKNFDQLYLLDEWENFYRKILK